MIELLISIIGTPQNEIQGSFLYLTSCILASLFFFYVLSLFKLIASTMKRF